MCSVVCTPTAASRGFSINTTLPSTPADRDPVGSPAASRQTNVRPRRHQALAGIAAATLIVIAAWFAVGGAKFDRLGKGGVNSSLLPKVGQIAPDFATFDVFGNPVRLSDFRGRPVWLMFWGSWCAPCRAEMPDIVNAYAKLKPDGLVLLGVSVRETPLDAAAYAGKNKANFLVLTDQDESDTGQAYPLYNVPTHIFIDAEGVIRSIVISDMDIETALRSGRGVLGSD